MLTNMCIKNFNSSTLTCISVFPWIKNYITLVRMTQNHSQESNGSSNIKHSTNKQFLHPLANLIATTSFFSVLSHEEDFRDIYKKKAVLAQTLILVSVVQSAISRNAAGKILERFLCTNILHPRLGRSIPFKTKC